LSDITSNVHATTVFVIFGLDDRGSVPGRDNNGIFSLLCRVQTSSVAHPVSYPVGTGGKAARTWSWPLTSVQWQG